MEKQPEIKIFKKDELQNIDNTYITEHNVMKKKSPDQILEQKNETVDIVNNKQKIETVDIVNNEQKIETVDTVINEADDINLIKELEKLSDSKMDNLQNTKESDQKDVDEPKIVSNRFKVCLGKIKPYLGKIKVWARYIFGKIVKLYKYVRACKYKNN